MSTSFLGPGSACDRKEIRVVCVYWSSFIWGNFCLHKSQHRTTTCVEAVLLQTTKARAALASVSDLPIPSDFEHLIALHASACSSNPPNNHSDPQKMDFQNSILRTATIVTTVCLVRIAATEWAVFQHSVAKVKDRETSYWGHSSFKVSDFFKLPMTVGYLVCRDRAHTNIPMSNTLNCLTSWKWNIIEFLPGLLLLLLLWKYFNWGRQCTNRHIFSIWIPEC